jgi:hypothetical protein
VSVRSLLAAQTLAGQSFEDYVMAFPSQVSAGDYAVTQDVPLGGAGRPWDETAQLARDKLMANFPGDATVALNAIDELDNAADVREITKAFARR